MADPFWGTITLATLAVLLALLAVMVIDDVRFANDRRRRAFADDHGLTL